MAMGPVSPVLFHSRGLIGLFLSHVYTSFVEWGWFRIFSVFLLAGEEEGGVEARYLMVSTWVELRETTSLL